MGGAGDLLQSVDSIIWGVGEPVGNSSVCLGVTALDLSRPEFGLLM